MNRQKLFSIVLLLLAGTISFAQNEEETYPTFNSEIALGIGQDSIAVYALIAAGNENKETVILLHGLPGNERNLDLAQDLRAEGKNVIYFNYRGAWGSQGQFLYSNCIEDVSHVLDYLSDTSNVADLHIDTSKFVLFGHSLGAGIALIAGAKDKRVKKVISLSGFNISAGIDENTTLDSLQGFQNYLNSLFMLNCDGKAFLQEVIDNYDAHNTLTYKKELKAKSVLILNDFEDENHWSEQLKGLVDHHFIASDHSFTNKRKEMSSYVLNWLEKN